MPHVTVAADAGRRIYTAGVSQTVFSVPFPFYQSADLRVYVNGVLQPTSAYTVTGTAVDGGFQSGTVTFGVAPATGATVTISRATAIQRTTDFPYPSQTLDIRSLNTELDRVTMVQQEQADQRGRFLRVSDSEPSINELPAAAVRANGTQTYDGSGQPIIGPGLQSIIDASVAGTGVFVQTGTGAVARPVSSKLREMVSVGDFGAVGDGVTDDAPAINAAITAVRAKGGGIVQLLPLHGISSTVVPRSFVDIVGPSQWNVRTLAPFAQTAGTQWFSGALTGVLMTCIAGFEAAVNARITAAQWCKLEIQCAGFNSTSNIALDIASATTTVFDYTVFPLGATSNTIWNEFIIYSTMGGSPLRAKGKYGTTPTASPANSANVPEIVITANRYVIDAYNMRASLQLIGAVDSEVFEHCNLNLATNGMVAVDIACDSVFTGNNYCNSHHFHHLMFSKQAAVTSGTLIRSGWSFGNRGVIEHDLGPDPFSGLTTLVPGASISHNFTMKNNGNLSPTSNLLTMTLERGHYRGADDGFATLPVYGFAADPGAGLFRSTATGEVGVSMNGLVRALFGLSIVDLGGNSATAGLRVPVDPANVNHVLAVGNAAGGAPGLFSSGADANPPLCVGTKGSGSILFRRNYGGVQQTVFEVGGSAGTDFLQTQAGSAVAVLAAAGASANVDILMTPKGTGRVSFGTYTAGVGPAYAGTIEIKDAGGTLRKVMVAA